MLLVINAQKKCLLRCIEDILLGKLAKRYCTNFVCVNHVPKVKDTSICVRHFAFTAEESIVLYRFAINVSASVTESFQNSQSTRNRP